MFKTKKKIGIAVLLVLMFLSGSITGWWVFANPGSPTWVLEQNSMSVCASYIIGRRDASTSYVRDGETGEIVFTNTTDVYTFAEARNLAYDDGGGLVFVRAGTYDFAGSSLGERNNVCWKGEGPATVITGENKYMRAGNNSVFSNIKFDGVYIYCSEYAFVEVENVTITDCVFQDCDCGVKNIGSNSIVTHNRFFSIGNGAFDQEKVAIDVGRHCDNIEVSFNTFTDCDCNGEHAAVIVVDQASNIIVSFNTIHSGLKRGISVYGDSRDCLVTQNIIHNRTLTGISLTALTGDSMLNVTLSGNHIYYCDDYAIKLISNGGYVNYTLIDGNHLVGQTIDISGLSKVVGTVFGDNKGFIAENNGLTTVANDEYVAHNIDSVLNVDESNSTVLVTPYTTVYDSVPVVVGCKAVNSTHIQVSAYWTNGTAITVDAIQVWWNVKYSS